MKSRARQFFSVSVILLIIGWLVVLLMLPSNPLDRLPGQDNGIFLYGGQQLLLGKIPYVDFWDHKGPLIYVINALGLFLAGGLRWGVWLLEFVFISLAAVGMYWTGMRVWGASVSWISLCAWAYALIQVGPYHHFRDSNYTESYNLLFSVGAVVLWMVGQTQPDRLRYYFFIGLLAGLSFLLRPNNIGVPASILIVETIYGIKSRATRLAIRRSGAVIAGSISIVLAFAFWFLSKGALYQFYDAVITFNVIYSRKENVYSLLATFVNVCSRLNWLPLIAFLLVAVPLLLGKKSSPQPEYSAEKFTAFLLIGWPVEILLSSISGRFLLHYFITWVPYDGWLAGAGLAAAVPRLRGRLEKIPAQCVSSVMLLALIVFSIPFFGQARTLFNHLLHNRSQGVEARSAVVRYIESHSPVDAQVLVWGSDVWINFLSRRASPSQYSYQSPLFLPGYTNREKILDFLGDLMAAPPVLIIEPVVDTNTVSPLNPVHRFDVPDRLTIPEDLAPVFEYIDSNYCVETTLNDIIIYRLSAGREGPPCP